MSRQKFIAITVSVIVIIIPACILPGVPAVINGTNQEPTVPIETRTAEVIASAAAAQTVLANAVASTLASMATNTPEFTLTPSLTPTPTFTFTPTVPLVSVSSNTYCRSGPGAPYDILGILNVGETAEVVGRNAEGDTWIIKLPSNTAIICWLWGQYATVTGNTAGLIVSTPPATPTPASTPTPAASFDVVNSSIEVCGGSVFAIKFQITNNGSVTWESHRVFAKYQVTSETTAYERNDFPNFNDSGCGLLYIDQNLAAGQVGFTTTAPLHANPAGHSFTATIRVCSLDGMAGTCLEKTITFTP
jgi:hypothetical protein